MKDQDLREIYTAIALLGLTSNKAVTQAFTALDIGALAVRVADNTMAALKGKSDGSA